ncbi:ribonuclease HI [Lentilactobacillus rapi DSM 19907 = JCM 15042]|uniref:Ribonuclease HI n=2 Tax=Lentilactobacillus rapi TaxID=481723 RepID=A0A512PJB0_9LACO|nr:ribonuclease HI family protein [Lentilactobacillus rapi]KRL15880.1 ribonuclease HI [Lentilactobacillus rapi DSM 19907 = JCM 15042]GEP71276.1 ribonuclease HI [Lentilactobacillus rapi]
MYKIYSDAAVNQNNQHAAIGILILHDGQQIQFKQRIASTNNHEAEFIAAIKAFEKLATLNQDPNEFVFYYTDSKIVIDSLNKSYAKHFQAEVDHLIDLQSKFTTVVNTWIPDSQNHGAHFLALQALHAIKD